MKRKYFAHSLENKPTDKWHLLDEHLMDTAKLARSFASVFRAGEWAYLAGLWHSKLGSTVAIRRKQLEMTSNEKDLNMAKEWITYYVSCPPAVREYKTRKIWC